MDKQLVTLGGKINKSFKILYPIISSFGGDVVSKMNDLVETNLVSVGIGDELDEDFDIKNPWLYFLYKKGKPLDAKRLEEFIKFIQDYTNPETQESYYVNVYNVREEYYMIVLKIAEKARAIFKKLKAGQYSNALTEKGMLAYVSAKRHEDFHKLTDNNKYRYNILSKSAKGLENLKEEILDTFNVHLSKEEIKDFEEYSLPLEYSKEVYNAQVLNKQSSFFIKL